MTAIIDSRTRALRRNRIPSRLWRGQRNLCTQATSGCRRHHQFTAPVTPANPEIPKKSEVWFRLSKPTLETPRVKIGSSSSRRKLPEAYAASPLTRPVV